MAISPPSDIVNDVARAADPARYQAAAQRLSEGAGPIAGASFDNAMQMVSSHFPLASGADVYSLRNSLRNNAESTAAAKSKQAHEQFEAYVLQTFIDSMLPKDAENTFGKGTAGSVWKSMMVEQMSAQIAKAGGVGIAKHLLKDRNENRSSGTPAVSSSSAMRLTHNKI